MVFTEYLYAFDSNVSDVVNGRYPTSREVAGRSTWTVLHNTASMFPERPSKLTRKHTRTMIKNMVKYFPCKECKDEATHYIKEHRPNLRSKRSFMKWVCDFHNHVNKRLGKPVIDCEAQQRGEECTTCAMFGKDHRIDVEPQVDADFSDLDLSLPFDDIKDSTRDIIEELCDRAEIPVPEIIFGKCPAGDTSCTGVSKEEGEVVGKIYLDPMQFSPRTIIHEWRHYHNAVKGDDAAFHDEEATEAFARDIIYRHFPQDTDAEPHKHVEIAHDTPERGGMVSMFDPMLKPFVPKGMTVSDMGDAHVPEIIGYSVQALQDMVFSPFGRVLSSVAIGAGLLFLSGFVPDSHKRDRKFTLELGAHMFWSWIRNVNPTTNQDVWIGAKAAGAAVGVGDWTGLMNSIFSTTMTSQKVVVQPPQQVMKATAAVNNPINFNLV